MGRLYLSDNYRKTSNISRTSVGNNIVDNSDVVGASPVGAAPTTSSFPTYTWLQWIERRQLQEDYKKHLDLGFGAIYTRGFTVAQFFFRDNWSAYWELDK